MASKAVVHVHRLPIFDDQHNPTNDHLLLNVRSTSGGFPLTFEATEGEAPYQASLSASEASRLRDKKHQKSKEEWQSTLLSIFLRAPVDDEHPSNIADNLEVFAILSSTELSIVIRRKLGEIKQRLGEIPLQRNEEYEIDTLKWAHTAVSRGNTLASDLQSLQTKFSDQETTIAKLNQQLEDLISAKREHDEALMTKFCELLNAKKLKIRDQQRLLASAKVDPKRALEVRASRNDHGRRTPASSRKAKRKAAPLEEEGEEEDGDDDADEEFAAADAIKQEDSEDNDQRQTPEATDEEDGDVTEDEEGEPVQNRLSGAVETPDQSKPAVTADQDVDMDMNDIPPTRSLPFDKKAVKNSASAEKAEEPTSRQEASNKDDETTDDEDDEL